MLDLADLGPEVLQWLRRLLSQIERGEIGVTAHHEGLDKALAQLTRLTNRLAISILTAALTVGVGLLMLIYHPPVWANWTGWLFGLVFTTALILGVGVL